jgi:transposase
MKAQRMQATKVEPRVERAPSKGQTGESATDSPASKRREHAVRKHKAAKRRLRARQVINPDAAGVDIGSKEHWTSVQEHRVDQNESAIRGFGVTTDELDAIIIWFKKCKVKTIVMEATGSYWMAPYRKFVDAGFEVILVDAHAVKHVPGRKSDIRDCQWLRELHTYGLLRGAFIPEEQCWELREYMRQHKNLVEASSRAILRVQKALTEMNVLLHQVLSDITGESGLRILDAILAGERDPARLAELADRRVKKTRKQIEAALYGNYKESLLFVIEQQLATYRHLQKQIAECETKVQEHLQKMTSKAPAPEQPKSAPPNQPEVNQAKAQPNQTSALTGHDGSENAPKRKGKKRLDGFEQAMIGHLRRIIGVDLTQLPGMGIRLVLMLLGEIGTNMERWRNEKAFCSWLGLCPNHKISGGRILSKKSRKVVSRAATAFRVAAQALGKTQTPLGFFYRRMKARVGPAKATTATAHKLARLVYRLIKSGNTYKPIDMVEYEQAYKARRIESLRRQAVGLGCKIVEDLPKAA